MKFTKTINKQSKLNMYRTLKESNYPNNQSEYKYMLEKCMSHYYSSKFKYKIKQLKIWGLCSTIFYMIFSLIKYSFVLYYYIMWEVDIRKPKVSNYIIERYR
jgi:hypothetical protein